MATFCGQLTSLELISEGVRSVMDEKGRELKRARTVRTEYAADVEEIQRWLRDAELKVQDRSVQPQKLKDYIQVGKNSYKIEYNISISLFYTCLHRALSK